MKRFAITASAGLVAIAFAIAGCGGSTATTAPAAASSTQAATPAASAASGASAGGQASSGASQAAPPSAGTAAGGAGQPIKVCDLLPVATVASIDGQSLTEATEQDVDPALQEYGCYYGGANLDGVTVTVAYGAASSFDTLQQVMQANSNAKVINGLGDKAFSTSIGVYALFGDVQIEVSGLQSDDAAATLIKTLQPKL